MSHDDTDELLPMAESSSYNHMGLPLGYAGYYDMNSNHEFIPNNESLDYGAERGYSDDILSYPSLSWPDKSHSYTYDTQCGIYIARLIPDPN